MVTKLNFKYPEVVDVFLKTLKEYGFDFTLDPLYGYLYIKGKLSYVGFSADGTAEMSLIDDNKYLKVEINPDNITVRLVRSDPDQGIKVKDFVFRKNIRVYTYTDFGYLTIEY